MRDRRMDGSDRLRHHPRCNFHPSVDPHPLCRQRHRDSWRCAGDHDDERDDSVPAVGRSRQLHRRPLVQRDLLLQRLRLSRHVQLPAGNRVAESADLGHRLQHDASRLQPDRCCGMWHELPVRLVERRRGDLDTEAVQGDRCRYGRCLHEQLGWRVLLRWWRRRGRRVASRRRLLVQQSADGDDQNSGIDREQQHRGGQGLHADLGVLHREHRRWPDRELFGRSGVTAARNRQRANRSDRRE